MINVVGLVKYLKDLIRFSACQAPSHVKLNKNRRNF